MDRSWFDSDDLGLGLGLGLGRRWGASPGSPQSSLLEMELQASSLRLRETARLAVTGHTGLQARRTHLAHRINTIMRNTGDDVKCSQAGEYDELNKNLRAIKEENLKLKAVINDVTEVNKRWQKYNNDRQIYVQRLLTTIQDQQDQINKMVANRAFTTPPVVEGTETSSLQDAVARLQRQIERLGVEHGETVQVLKFQVKAHHDDWEAERREKQQALQDKLTAEAKIRQLQKDLRSHKLKLREDRLETENRCGCRCCHSCDAGPDPSVSRLDLCRNDSAKTYRTSVHVPCNAGHLLSRGTTLSFDDDLATDAGELQQQQTSRSSSDRCLPGTPDDAVKQQTSRSGSDRCLSGTPDDAIKQQQQQTSRSDSDRCLPGAEEEGSNAAAVRMGFSHAGLASILSFSQTPIVKSCSLPNPSGSSDSERPDSFAASAESLYAPLGRPSPPGAAFAAPPAWKPKYFEHGVDTQTREDIICPVCDRLFPPTSHVKFLDHFGKCQNDAMMQRLKRV